MGRLGGAWRRYFIAALCVVPGLTAVAVNASPLELLLMPGRVIQGHLKYEEECEKCHDVADRGKQTPLCLDCHKDVNRDIREEKGYHGRHARIKDQKCRDCHTEHKGREADVVKLDKLTFDHRLTDYPLKGRHAAALCEGCHRPEKKFREAVHECHTCHKDDNPHKDRLEKLGEKCQTCHQEKGWPVIDYAHDKTKFPLTGKHEKIRCADCHPNDRLFNIAKECNVCHRIDDVHEGKVGEKCKKCHETRDWKKPVFKHDTDTAFPLRDKHKPLKCQTCHREDAYKKRLPADCRGCHEKDDKHRGRYGEKCRDCHAEAEWKKIRFDHTRDTAYRLNGKHVDARCADCHKGHLYKETLSTLCHDCHKLDDVHRSEEGLENRSCERCHNENGWHKKLAFDHDVTHFPLIGLHAITACEECHPDSNFRAVKAACYECHKKDDTHRRRLGTPCALCHNPNGWNIWRFDHDAQSKFKIEGAHKKLHCDSCHTEQVDKVASTPRTCFACHRLDDRHRGQFGEQCDRCHTTRSFRDFTLR
jgi:hypothetical protein